MSEYTFMSSLTLFKVYMTSSDVPNYVVRYCECLDEKKREWFYEQMKAAIKIVSDVGYMFYSLKWILKHNFEDLTYEIYFQDYMNPEMRSESLIKEKWRDRLHENYIHRLMSDLSECKEEGHE